MIKGDLYTRLQELKKKHNIKIETICPNCNKHTVLEVNVNDYFDFKEGKKHIQEAFPYLSADEREMLLTGLCKECWDKLFKEEE